MNGSDTLFNVTQDVITSCKLSFTDPTLSGIVYVGGGSGVGAAQMVSDVQRIAPMSRTLKNSEFCGANQTTTEAYMVGVDGIAIVANAAGTCGNDPTLLPGSANGVALDSLVTLRQIYFGFDLASNTFDCNGATRRTLIGTWANLFSTSPTCATGNASCATGLRHAYRRSDLSGTTDAFVTLVGAGSRAIGNNPFAIGAVLSKKQNPFCNTQDANTASAPTCGATVACSTGFACDTPTDPMNGGHCVLSDGGRGDFSDVDPIRIPCATNESVCEPTNGLGLVLPIFLPDVATVVATDDYPAVNCDSGSCELQAPAASSRIPVGFRCPDGQAPSLGRCWHPKHTVSGVANFACRNARTSHCFGAATADGRSYNKALIKPDSTRAAAFALDANNRLMNASFFRMHSNPAETVPCVTAVDDTTQIGCLTNADPCTLGYAGREAAPAGSFKALSVQGIYPTDAKIIDLLPLSQQGTGGDGSSPYPLARRLYLATLKGFQVLQGGENELAKCYADNAIAAAAISGNGFVPVPVGVQCLDYDESPDTAAGVITATEIGSGGCAGVASGTNVNSCANGGTANLGPSVTDVQAILNTNCISCHSGATPPNGLDLTNIAAFTGAQQVVGVASVECAAKQRINPGSSMTSYIIDKLDGAAQDGGCFSGAQMPRGAAPLTPAQISLIAQWIDHGALRPHP
jgi:hypothetical protein